MCYNKFDNNYSNVQITITNNECSLFKTVTVLFFHRMLKKDNRGIYMASMPKEERSNIMRERAKQKWALMSDEQRSSFIRKLVEARKAKKK